MYFYGIECVSVNFLIVFCASINKHIMGFSELKCIIIINCQRILNCIRKQLVCNHKGIGGFSTAESLTDLVLIWIKIFHKYGNDKKLHMGWE